MNKEQYISNQLAVRIANLEVEKAQLEADNAILSQQVEELKQKETDTDVEDK